MGMTFQTKVHLDDVENTKGDEQMKIAQEEPADNGSHVYSHHTGKQRDRIANGGFVLESRSQADYMFATIAVPLHRERAGDRWVEVVNKTGNNSSRRTMYHSLYATPAHVQHLTCFCSHDCSYQAANEACEEAAGRWPRWSLAVEGECYGEPG